jgi:hypothetical protein
MSASNVSGAARRRQVLAEIRAVAGAVELWVGQRQLLLKKLPKEARDALGRLPTTVMLEVDVEEQDGTLVALHVGSVRPNPRVAALRAAKDERFGDALEQLDSLGEAVETDRELLRTRLLCHGRLGREKAAEADFRRLLGLPEGTLEQALDAFDALWAEKSQERCAPDLVTFAEGAMARGGTGQLPQLLARLPRPAWGARLPLAALRATLAERDLGEAELRAANDWLEAARTAGAGTREVAAAEQAMEEARRRLSEKEGRAKKGLLASRPDFNEVERLFAVRLPPALRQAWEAHYEGRTVGFGFIEVKKGKVEKLAALAKKLERALEGEVRRPAPKRPHQLLPFAVGEHEDDYFALDLACPAGADDFAVRGVFGAGLDGEVLAYPSSKAWLAADGAPRY